MGEHGGVNEQGLWGGARGGGPSAAWRGGKELVVSHGRARGGAGGVRWAAGMGEGSAGVFGQGWGGAGVTPGPAHLQHTELADIVALALESHVAPAATPLRAAEPAQPP